MQRKIKEKINRAKESIINFALDTVATIVIIPIMIGGVIYATVIL